MPGVRVDTLIACLATLLAALLLCSCRGTTTNSPTMGSKVNARLPVHLAMTEATRHRFQCLEDRICSTAPHIQQQQEQHQQQQQPQQPRTVFLPADEAGGHHKSKGSSGSCIDDKHPHGNSTARQLCSLVALTQQLATVTVEGRVLTQAHVHAGSYMQPDQLPSAAELILGALHCTRM